MFHSVRTRVVATFIAAILIAGTVAVAIGGWVADAYSKQVTGRENSLTATLVATAVGSFGEQAFAPASPEYEGIRSYLREVCINYGIDFIYVGTCDVGESRITYLTCVARDDADDATVREKLGYGVQVEVEPGFIERALSDDMLSDPYEIDNDYGHTLAWLCPVEGFAEDAFVGVEITLNEQVAAIWRIALIVALAVLVALLLLLVVELRVLEKRVFAPVRLIAGRMRSFSAERADELEPLGIDTGDEMADIAEAFEGMAANIGKYTRDIEHMTAERVASDVELGVARRIQLGMVPERCELHGAGFELAALSRPTREVGGDFYDAVELGDGRVAVAVGDVSGKGVAAALFMAMAKAMVRNELQAGADPARALESVNAQLCASNPEGMFATAFAAVLDPATGTVRFANAGHVPPLVVSDLARPLEVESGTLLGLFDDAEVAAGEFALEAGESLLVCTDGADEAVNAKGAFLGEDGLMVQLDMRAPYACARSLVDAVVTAVDGFAGGREQFDDLTVVALRRTDSLPLRMESFNVVRAEILERSADADAARKACLACEEAFANIVSHSQASGIWCGVSSDGGALAVTLEDDGIPFDPLAAPPEHKPFEELDSGGMGISLIRSIATDAAYRRDAGRNVLSLRFEQR